MRLARQSERGDTIIEVLFAVTVFAMVAVGSLSIMNQGTGSAQRSLEVTLVRAQIDAQAEAIRFIHQAYVTSYQKNVEPAGIAAGWTDIVTNHKKDVPSAYGALTADNKCPDAVPPNAFIMNARIATVSGVTPTMRPPEGSSLPPFAQVAYNGDVLDQAYGMWVEAVPSAATDGPDFVDFHIRACWDSPGAAIPVTLGTIVRLYEPN